jgi:hypothetical protein
MMFPVLGRLVLRSRILPLSPLFDVFCAFGPESWTFEVKSMILLRKRVLEGNPLYAINVRIQPQCFSYCSKMKWSVMPAM